MRVAAPADRRFRRAQVKPARRRASWPMRLLGVVRTVVVVGALGGAGWFAARAVLDARVLLVSSIRVKGNEHLARGEVMALLSGLEGTHILLLDLEPWRKRLLASPWVQRAALRRVLPSTVEVVIQERRPMAVGRVQGELWLVDDQGMVIDEYGPNYAQFDLPIVDGLGDVPSSGPTVSARKAGLAARVISALGARQELLKKVSQIDVSNERDAVLLLDSDPALIHVGDQQFAERVQGYLDLAEALRARVPAIEYVDMRFDGRVFVRPAAAPRVRKASLVR
jgi:cell division septal protein FtsQ